MTYEETLHYLYTSIPVFQNAGPSAYKPGLGTSIALDDHLGNPHKAYNTRSRYERERLRQPSLGRDPASVGI